MNQLMDNKTLEAIRTKNYDLLENKRLAEELWNLDLYYEEIGEKYRQEREAAKAEKERRIREERRLRHYIPPEEHEDEKYRDVVGNSRYEISEYGNIRNKKLGYNLKPYLDQNGYLRIGLAGDNGHEGRTVHRLVARAFLSDTYEEGLEVNHKDGNKLNNHYSNLEWVTTEQNLRHAMDNGLIDLDKMREGRIKTFREKFPPVRCLENGKVYPDARVAADDLNLCQYAIRAVCRGEYKSHGGYHFENADWSEINVEG